jgi:hypothetical protein
VISLLAARVLGQVVCPESTDIEGLPVESEALFNEFDDLLSSSEPLIARAPAGPPPSGPPASDSSASNLRLEPCFDAVQTTMNELDFQWPPGVHNWCFLNVGCKMELNTQQVCIANGFLLLECQLQLFAKAVFKDVSASDISWIQ